MEPPISPLLYSVLLFVGMLIMLEFGCHFGIKRRSKEADNERSNLGAIEGAVFARLVCSWHSLFRERRPDLMRNVG